MYNFRHLYLARVHKGTETKTNREIKKQNGHGSSTNPCTGQCLALGWKSSVHPLPAQQSERDNKGMLRLEEQLEEEQQKVFIAFNTREEHKRKKNKTQKGKTKENQPYRMSCGGTVYQKWNAKLWTFSGLAMAAPNKNVFTD